MRGLRPRMPQLPQPVHDATTCHNQCMMLMDDVCRRLLQACPYTTSPPFQTMSQCTQWRCAYSPLHVALAAALLSSVARGGFVVSSGNCEVTNSGLCVSSPNFDAAVSTTSTNYGNNEYCRIDIRGFGGNVPISSTLFSTESGYDYLTIGGTSYQGASSIDVSIPASSGIR